jgi:hypothetical protein
VILGIAGSLIACCGIAVVAAIVLGIINVGQQNAPIEAVIDSFMSSMEGRNSAQAYALFSPRVQRIYPESKLKEGFKGENYVLYEGYESISLTHVKVSIAANTDPEKPQGIVASVSGKITYQFGIEGSFTGTLEKVDGVWRLFYINIRVPYNKFYNPTG